MFDGVPDQFHQFITPRTSSSSLPLHLPFPLSTTPNNNNNNSNNTFPTFDPYNHHQLPLQLQPNTLLHPLHHHNNKDEQKEQTTPTSINNFQIERDQRQILPQLVDPWTNDEVLALLKIRSNMENWFPDFTWEHVSRKLAEIGFKRSAEKCKEKFEEESRFFNNIGNNNNNNQNQNPNQNQNNYGKNFRFVTELEELYQGGGGGENKRNEVQDKMRSGSNDDGSRSGEVLVMKKDEDEVFEKSTTNEERKRKRGGDRFEVFKGFCESVVKKMMDQQEEMHNKLIEDMIRRDEEKYSREEAWKKQEMEKMNKELELMAQEQAIASDRQASIIQFLNKFSSTTNSSSILASIQSIGIGKQDKSKVITPKNFSNSTTLHSLNPNPEIHDKTLQPTSENPSSTLPSSSTTLAQPRKYSAISSGEKEDIGRRWPKDEVLALINLRCNYNNNEEKEGSNNTNKAPLWERISQGMLELGYKRSAKRCKEKWENINKYFRKTKDNANRKRSLDSRTCPYFHLLSNLYNQGKLVLQSEKNESNNNMNVPEEIVVQEKKAPQDENKGGGGESSDQVGPACW